MRAENQTPVRTSLDAAALRRAAVRPGGLWRDIEVVESTGSTNADLLARALRGEPEGMVLATEDQRAGRGRMGRSWITPPRAALTFSLLVRPEMPVARRGWLPLLTGVAVAEAITGVTGVRTVLKWPNDVLAGPGKLVGILAEAAGDAVVAGIGVNVCAEACELPERGPGALPAASLLTAVLTAFERWYLTWRQAGGDPEESGLRAGYTGLSGTIGRQVRAELPGGQALSGSAVGVDADGRLLVRSSSGTVPVAAADVVHLR